MSASESLAVSKPPEAWRRILSQLRKGPLTQAAFDNPTCDGYPRIPQIARRIQTLRDRDYVIRTDRPEDGGYCSYTLLGEPEARPDPVFAREPFDRIETSQVPTDRGDGDDDRQGQRESQPTPVGAVSTAVSKSGPAPGADLTRQCQNGPIQIPATCAAPPAGSRLAGVQLDLFAEAA